MLLYTLPYYIAEMFRILKKAKLFSCVFDQIKKSSPNKVGMISLESQKSSNFFSRKIIHLKSSSARATRFLQQPTYPTTVEIFHQYLPTVGIQCSTFVEYQKIYFLLEVVCNDKKQSLSLWS